MVILIRQAVNIDFLLRKVFFVMCTHHADRLRLIDDMNTL